MKKNVDIYELVPKSSRKSFNRKAFVIVVGDCRYLKSYDTIMGCIDGKGKIHRYSDFRSNTTDCHIKSFFPDSKAFRAAPLEKCPKITVTL